MIKVLASSVQPCQLACQVVKRDWLVVSVNEMLAKRFRVGLLFTKLKPFPKYKAKGERTAISKTAALIIFIIFAALVNNRIAKGKKRTKPPKKLMTAPRLWVAKNMINSKRKIIASNILTLCFLALKSQAAKIRPCKKTKGQINFGYLKDSSRIGALKKLNAPQSPIGNSRSKTLPSTRNKSKVRKERLKNLRLNLSSLAKKYKIKNKWNSR